jgi:hypothetical protein
MLGNRKLIVDNFCEVKEFTQQWQDAMFWDFTKHEIVPGAVYLISRQQFTDNIDQLRQLASDQTIIPILGNPAEGSETMFRQIVALGILDLVRQNKILVVSGGYLPPDVPSLYHENFLPKILDYDENIHAAEEYRKLWTADRPYKFLFLNGRGRRHRRQLIGRLAKLLPESIWTNLDSAAGPIQLLDPKYEFDFYQDNTQQLPQVGYVKYQLFNNDWGEIYLNPRMYLDTYFSLITETVFEYPWSFRTEKLWKPIAIGHPFIVASNSGYYKDLHKLGFRTFGHLIDESFDQIDNNQDRLERIAQVVEDLCQQDLAAFITAADETCKYNQQLLAELRPQVRQEFPQRFEQYINERS